MALTVATAGTGVARTAHYVTPTGASAPIQTLLLEPQRTNLCIRSEQFDTWTQTVCVVTANASVAPDGTTTADLITPSADTNGRVRRNVTFTGDAEKCISVYLKAGTSTRSRFTLRDTTAATDRVGIRITWSAGVPTPSAFSGSGTIYPVEALANGWYRILVSAVGVIAANTNEVAIFADDSAGTGTVLAWGAQAENAIVPSSYIKTEATTVTRNADSFYLPFTAPPQQMTVYVRGVEQENPALVTKPETGIVSITASPLVDASYGISRPGLSANYATFHDPATIASASTSASAYIRGDVVELRSVLRSTGSVQIGAARNGGAETTSAISAAQPLAASWSAPRLYFGSYGGASAIGQFAFTHVAVVPGIQTMAEMRAIAGVS